MKLDLSKTSVAARRVKEGAKASLWRQGEWLPLVLDSTQQEMVKAYKESESTFYIWLCSRRLGKSHSLWAMSVEAALSQPNSRILYLSKTTDNVKEIVNQVAIGVLDSCPAEIMPTLKVGDNKYVFNNGSEIRIKGLDTTGPDAIRGVGADLVVLDEFCFMRHLDNLISSVLMPMVIERGGRILMGSTPPSTPGHDSINWINKAKMREAITVKTIYDCPRWSKKQIDQFAEEAGGVDSDTFKLEYLCQIIVNREKAILPSMDDERVDEMVQEILMPSSYLPDRYVSLDIGFRDLTVALFGWWDYDKARLVIQDEVVLEGKEATTDNIAKMIMAKEKELWPGLPPPIRVCDTDPRLIADLRKISNLFFRPTKKDNKEAQINQTNIMINRSQIYLDPKCKTLLTHMRYGVWNEARTQFARTAALGHCDAVDALLYLVRNINRGRDPYEAPFINNSTTIMHHGYAEKHKSQGIRAIEQAFAVRRKRR